MKEVLYDLPSEGLGARDEEEDEFWSAEDKGLTLLDASGGGETPRFSDGDASGAKGLLPVGVFGLWAMRLGFFDSGAEAAGSAEEVGEHEGRLEDSADEDAQEGAFPGFPGESPTTPLAAARFSI